MMMNIQRLFWEGISLYVSTKKKKILNKEEKCCFILFNFVIIKIISLDYKYD